MARVRARTLAPLALALAATAVVGCGGSSEPSPAADRVVLDALRALQGERAKRVRYELDARVALTPADGAQPLARFLSAARLRLQAEGAIALGTLLADGRVEAAGEEYAAKLMAGDSGFFVRWKDVWYGTEDVESTPLEGGLPDEEGYDRSLAELEAAAGRLFAGEVRDGPDMDGETWKVDLELDREAVVELARSRGLRPTRRELEQLERLADGLELTLVAGKDDKLPRALELKLEGAPASWGIGEAEGQVERASVALSLKLSDWGEEVAFEPPRDYRAIEGLLFGLLGRLFPQGSIEFGDLPIAPQPGPAPEPGLPDPAPPPEVPEVEVPPLPAPDGGQLPVPEVSVPPPSVPPPTPAPLHEPPRG